MTGVLAWVVVPWAEMGDLGGGLGCRVGMPPAP